jgi:hypothetical protein
MTYLAAFGLGAILGLIAAAPAHAAESFRLERVAVTRFTPTPDGRMNMAEGVLDTTEQVTWRTVQSVPKPGDIPGWALDQYLARVDSWLEYLALGGSEVVANFEAAPRAAAVTINGKQYVTVKVKESARVFTGSLINISTMGRLAGGTDTLISGFVIEDRPRAVLIRAVGPGLGQFDVPGFAPDPFLSIKRNSTTIYFNDDWDDSWEAFLIRGASSRVGAFPLQANSRDAVRLVILEPGAYTVHVSAAPMTPGGQVLLEVYSVPEEVFDGN